VKLSPASLMIVEVLLFSIVSGKQAVHSGTEANLHNSKKKLSSDFRIVLSFNVLPTFACP
jgi:hypothetical protein